MNDQNNNVTNDTPEWVKLGVPYAYWLKVVKEAADMERRGYDDRQKYYADRRERNDRHG